MNERDSFPDYKPKTTPDTIYDYLRTPKTKIFEILTEIGEPSLAKLKLIEKYFNKYKKKAEKSPGGTQKGNISIGADFNQYYPSEEEMLVSELGNMIYQLLISNSKEDIEKTKKKEGIKTKMIEFYEIYYRHVDVMGSGRYFYAEKKEPKIQFKL